MRQDLLNALAQIQNHPACINQDIMTFAGLMDETEIRQHIEANMGRVARWSEKSAAAPVWNVYHNGQLIGTIEGWNSASSAKTGASRKFNLPYRELKVKKQ